MKKNGDIMIKGNKINVKGSGDVIIKGSKIKENEMQGVTTELMRHEQSVDR